MQPIPPPRKKYPLDGSVPPPEPEEMVGPLDNLIFAAAERVADGHSTPAEEAKMLKMALMFCKHGSWTETVHRGLYKRIPGRVLSNVKPLMEAYFAECAKRERDPRLDAQTQAIIDEVFRTSLYEERQAERFLGTDSIQL